MNHRIPILAASLVLALAAGAAFAKGPGGGMGGGMSSPHISGQGMANTNGPNAADRDKGMARAQDRMSEEGQENSKAKSAKSRRNAKDKPARSGRE